MYPSWSECVRQLKTHISETEINNWVTPLHPVCRGNTLKLLAPNRYALDYVKKNLLPSIERIVLEQRDGIDAVLVEIGGHFSTGEAAETIVRKAPTLPLYNGDPMVLENTFENHVEGQSNQMARAAARQVGNSPGGKNNMNPLFLYGGVGLGKTHLMQAVGHLMLERNAGIKVLFVRAETFVSRMIAAINNNTMSAFKQHYRTQDALLIDDIHFLSGKIRSQEEFFHTFNTLFEDYRQIIMTSDCYPREMKKIDMRLISRFGAGMAVRIDPPDLETRIVILKKKVLTQNIHLPDDVAFFIASVVSSNVRELQGALHTVIAKSRFIGQPIDIDIAREALRDLLMHREKQMSIENIQIKVAEYFNLRVHDLLSKKRTRHIARPRQLAMYFTKEFTDLSLPQIGDRFGGRDHTTVLHACRRIADMQKTDLKLKEDFINLQRILEV